MKRNTIALILLAVIVLGSPLFALSLASSKALDAFRRYEPDFSNSQRRLEELDRRIINLAIDPDSSRMVEIKDEADEIMERVQRRYDLMEDLFTSVSGDYPADRTELFDGFSRIDDMYREIRDFHMQKFTYRGQKEASSTADVQKSATIDSKDSSRPVAVETAKTADSDASVQNVATASLAAPAKKESKVDVSGVLKLDFRNRNEVYRTQSRTAPFTLNETALPNNLSQAKLSLTYKFDDDRQLFVEDRFLKRKRNEPVHENYLTLAYLWKVSKERAWTFKNTLQHSWYPDNSTKDYRNNLAEVFYNERWSKRERLANIGYQTRFYPQYSRSDFHQLNFGDQETWFRKDGNLFIESKSNWRRYRNVNDLDYDNFNLYGEYSRSYKGNKAELMLSNTFDRRLYDRESVNLYRTSYYDNYFRATYDLPVHEQLSYSFEGQHQKRNYGADEPRGYSELNLFGAAKFKIDKDSRAQADYRYVYNDENTRMRAHKNHKFHGMWQKSYSKDFKVRVDDTLHLRRTVVGEVMDFRENAFSAKLSWRLKNSMDLTWNNEYLNRIYDEIFYRDYKYLLSGLNLAYAEVGKYDWKVSQSWRKFSFRNGNNISTGWDGESQPITELRYNYVIQQDLKLRLSASWEKSYYRSFDSLSQELLWDFTRPMTITEFFGGLEYTF
ncbi:MAG: hypothetical protein EOM80_11865 [Erysipelotrichia bacterium]|nr:hypothetical protein [Erysipelotrichia bacterium]